MVLRCRTFIIAVVVAAIGCSLGVGCSKAKRKFSVPKINMITSEYVMAVEEPVDGHVWIVGDYGMIYNSKDGGENWTEQKSGTINLLCDVDFVDEKTGWVSGIKGTMLHTTDGGATWEQQETNTKEHHLLSISFVDKEYGWAVGDYTTIMHTTDGGKTWKRQTEEQDSIYSKVFFIDREHGWLVGERGQILQTKDGGVTWNVVMPEFFKRETIEEEYENPRPSLFGIYFSDRDHGWLCGLDSTILHTADGGESWKVLNTGTDILYNIIVKGDRGWAIGSQGTYLLSRDGGITWEKLGEAIKSKLTFSNVYFNTPEKGWIVGASGTVVHSKDGGETWKFYSGLSYEFEGMKMPEGLEKRVIE